MSKINIDPEKIRQFGDSAGAVFCLITNPEIIGKFEIAHSGSYDDFLVIPFSSDQSFEQVLQDDIPQKAHVLVVSPFAFFQSPPMDKLGSMRKLIAMACNSTPTDMDTIAHFLAVLERTDPQAQEIFANKFFALGEAAEYLEISDSTNGTKARFDHLDDSYFWSEQVGAIEYGQQQLAPPGEVSVLPLRITDFDQDLRLNLNGTIALHGHPILHNGTQPFLRQDQQRLYEKLATMNASPIIAHVTNGVIDEISVDGPEAWPARDALHAMFEVDSRYRIVWEIGFAVNTTHEMLSGNTAMNETFGGHAGTLHFGLGLTPYTQYHLDIICLNTQVTTNSGDILIGGVQEGKKHITRNVISGCACLEGV